mgnify:FL=1
MQDLVIHPISGKGRSFQATLLAYALADSLWVGGCTGGDVTRPAWMLFGGSDSALRAFVANLQTGRKAVNPFGRKWDNNEKFEVLKSAGFQYAWQRTPIGSVVTVFLPDLFRIDPGMVDPKGIQFCLLPAKDWLQPADPTAEAHIRKLGVPKVAEKMLSHALALAPIFIAYLDRRTRCPLIPDVRFYAQVLVASLTVGHASWGIEAQYGERNWGENKSLAFREHGTKDAGMMPGIVFKADHAEFETFLAEQVRIYFEQVGHGSH